MDFLQKHTSEVLLNRTKHILLFLMISLFLSSLNTAVKAQTADSLSNLSTVVAGDSSIKPNNALKLVFKELKKEDSIWQTFAMIGGVLVIVGIAMYISFKDSGKESKA